MSECKCDLRTKLVEDGCEACNPKMAAEILRDGRLTRLINALDALLRDGDSWNDGCGCCMTISLNESDEFKEAASALENWRKYE